jgi:hypothetical protein
MTAVSHTAAVPDDRESYGLTVLCGAGLSIAPPASIPSRWQFNQSVLDGIRGRYQRDGAVPAHSKASIERLSLDHLDVAAFSQVIHDAFAGVTWFELLAILDVCRPNTRLVG